MTSLNLWPLVLTSRATSNNDSKPRSTSEWKLLQTITKSIMSNLTMNGKQACDAESIHSQLKGKSYQSSFYFYHIWFWCHDISCSDQSEHCSYAVLAKHSVCLHGSMDVSRVWPSDVRVRSWAWTLNGQSRFYFSPVGLIWLHFHSTVVYPHIQ